MGQLAWQPGGWAQGLAENLVRRVDIINRGFSGYNTRMIQTILPDIFTTETLSRARVVCIFLGSNDASMEDTNPEQAVPVEDFGENEKCTAALNMKPGPNLPNCKSNDLTKTFAVECGEVAKRFNLTFVDLFSHLMNPSNNINLTSALSDGLHLGKDGHDALLSLLLPVFNKKLGGAPDALMFPEWKELDNADTAGSYKEWKSKYVGKF